MEALLLVDIGNTHVRVYRPFMRNGERVFEPIQTLETAAWQTPLLLAAEQVWAASVVPGKNDLLRAAGAVRFLSPESCGARLQFAPSVNYGTLGADRLANAFNLLSRAKGAFPAIGIDCGSCVTFEILGRDGAFSGGAIFPGRMLMRRALKDHTGQLPLVPLSKARPAYPGKDTSSSIAWGIDSGLCGMLDALIAQAEAVHGPFQTRVLSGGDGAFFRSFLAERRFEYDPDSVVRGLYYALSGE